MTLNIISDLIVIYIVIYAILKVAIELYDDLNR